jgi:hypothetical protein
MQASEILVRGVFCQEGAPRVLSIFLYLRVSLFDLEQPFPRPDPRDRLEPARAEAVEDGAERHPQGPLVLEGFEHDGTLERVGMTKSEGSCGMMHERTRHILVCGGPKTQTMMQ